MDNSDCNNLDKSPVSYNSASPAGNEPLTKTKVIWFSPSQGRFIFQSKNLDWD